MSLPDLLEAVAACTACADLPLGPRPIVSVGPGARMVVIGQAPGTKVHASGIPWDDDSGERLRDWLAVDRATFYDPDRIALIPMGFCYPGRKGQGDAPPRPECAPLWHERLLAELPELELIVLAGMYAQRRYLGADRKTTLTATVAAWKEYGPRRFPIPHPAWRSRLFAAKHAWFEAELLTELRSAVALAVGR